MSSTPPPPCDATRVLFVVATLGLGGVERALEIVLRDLDRRRFAPALAVLQNVDVGMPLPADVTAVGLGRRSRWSFPRVAMRLSRLVRDCHPDVVVAFGGPANLAALAALRIGFSRHLPLLLTEHIAPTQMYLSAEEPLGRLKLWLLRRLYPRATAIVAVSSGVAHELVERVGIRRELVRVVHTPVDVDIVRRAAGTACSRMDGRPVVVSVGRLTPQKNHELLLRAAARMSIPPRIVLVGDGPERTRLEAVAEDLGISVDFRGADPNPYPVIASADVFVLPSRFEGFGVVLVEALALGTPVISTDCPHGPAEILGNGEYGELVPVGDEASLAQAIERLLTDDGRRARLAAVGPARADMLDAAATIPLLEREIEGATGRR